MTKTTLISDRITLRLINSSDLDFIHRLHSIPEVDKFNTLGIPKNIKETQSIIQSWIAEHNLTDIKSYTFAIEQNKSKVFIGLFGLNLSKKKYKKAEIWYKIHPDYWRKGFATESVNLVLDFGFDTLNLHRIDAGCAVDNVGSIKLLEKVGMIREGRGRQTLPLKNGWSDNFEYSILETDPRKK